MNPLAANPLRTREDLQNAVRQIVKPLDAFTTASGAWVIPGEFAADYGKAGTGLEGFARRLWGLAPLAMSGGAYDGWERIRAGLAAGTDPEHPEYWGDPRNIDVRLVETASLGAALALAPKQIWEPLSPRAKENVARWLNFANTRRMCENNWRFFTVLANLGLRTVGAPHSATATEAALESLENMYLSDGWYRDGLTPQRDYYIAFAMHYYSLICLAADPHLDRARADRFRERATVFAKDFAHWFTAEGAALPFGRSQTYRFAQASFWGALAFANVEAFPWGQIKGLLLRHLRWWAKQPIWTDGGALSVGYAYPNLIMAEQYNAPGSPYWALKSFLPLALPESHPFWQAEEEPLPPMVARRIMPHAGMIVCRDDAEDHIVALASGQAITTWTMRHAEQKFCKFAYSSAFGFCIDAGQKWHDNMLCFSEEGRHWFGRSVCLEYRVEPTELYSRWSPMPGVEVQTRISPRDLGHEISHRIRTTRQVRTVEAGFAASPGTGDLLAEQIEVGAHHAIIHGACGSCGIRDLSNNRTPEISVIEPNVNLLHTRSVAPLLTATLEPGEHEFRAAVVGVRNRARMIGFAQ